MHGKLESAIMQCIITYYTRLYGTILYDTYQTVLYYTILCHPNSTVM